MAARCGRPSMPLASASHSAMVTATPSSLSFSTIRTLRSPRPATSCVVRLASAGLAGSMPYPRMCSVAGDGISALISMPGRNANPRADASAAASATPPTVSWSVRASAVSPFRRASRTTSAGDSVPSEAVLWQCMST